MNADEHRLTEVAINALSDRIIGCAFPVSNTLGSGFLEKVYKATKGSPNAFATQCLNYLKATRLPLCLLFNFGKPRVEIKRYRR